MQSQLRARQRPGAAAIRLPRWLGVLFPCSIVGSVLGQSVLVPPPGFQGAPNVPAMGNVSGTTGQPNARANGQANGQANAQPGGETTTSTTEPGAEAPSGTGNITGTPLESLMQWGALHLRARASYQFAYDSGIHPQPAKAADTFTHTFIPGMSLAIGPHVGLDYSPSFRFFSQRDFHNTIDQSASLSAGAGLGDWSFGVFQSFTLTDEPMVETGRQTNEKNYNAGLNVVYQTNDKVSFDTSGSVGLLFVGGQTSAQTNAPVLPALSDSQNYSASEWVNYQFDEKFGGALGITVGYSSQEGGFTSLDEQYSGRISWKPGSKLSVLISAGLDDQQFLNTDAQDVLNPIFTASIGYRLFEQTTLSLSAARSINASLFQNQITETTQVGFGIQQRLLGKLQLSLGFGYTATDYKDTTGNLKTSRSDTGTSYSVGLGVPFLTHLNFGAFYVYSQNTSSVGALGYSSSQVGASLGWSY